MPLWNKEYYDSLSERFDSIVDGLSERLDDVIEGRVIPAVEGISIGSAKSVRAAVMFFDICNFSSRTSSADINNMKNALLMLDCVIPMIMHVVHDYGGYVEKNTGDGVMAIVGVEDSDEEAANATLDIATGSFYVLNTIVNPYLKTLSIDPVSMTIGIDMGSLLLARIGVPKGSAKTDRSFLTAVGPSANLACRLQSMAGENEIWTGDQIFEHAALYEKKYFLDMTPYAWTWHYYGNPSKTYRIWRYNAIRLQPR